MGKIILLLVFCFAVFYGLSTIQNVAKEPARQSVRNFVSNVAHPEKSARQQLGIYGEKLPTNQARDLSLMNQPHLGAPQPKTLSSPYGTRGNNFSLYDINSPSGQFGKL